MSKYLFHPEFRTKRVRINETPLYIMQVKADSIELANPSNKGDGSRVRNQFSDDSCYRTLSQAMIRDARSTIYLVVFRL